MIPRLLQSAESWCGLIPRKQFAVNPAGAGCQDPGYGRRAVTTRAPNEGYLSLTEVLLSIIKKAPTRAVLWLGSVLKKFKKTYPKETSFFYNNQP